MSAPLPPTPYPPPSAAVRVRSYVMRLLWTLIPFGTVGLCGWVPALHIARRRRTPASWWWLTGLVAGMVAEVTVVELIPKNTNFLGSLTGDTVVIGYLITATVYAWRGCGPGLPALRPVSPPWSGPVPGYPAAPGYPSTLVGPTAPATPSAAFPPIQPMPPVSPVSPVPAAAASDMAAEVQAELRELRGFLGGEDAR